MTWDEHAAGWDDEPAVRAYAGAAYRCLEELEQEGRVRVDGARVLDFGCGTGLLTEALAPRAAHVVALDTSAAMVKVLNNKTAQRGWENVVTVAESLEAAAERFPEAFEPSFDLIVCSSVLAFVDDYAAMVKALASHLSEGGALVQWDWELNPGDDEPYGLTRDGIRAALEGAGLTDVSVSTGFEQRFEGEVMRPLMGVGRQRGKSPTAEG